MPEYYGIGINSVHGDVVFTGQKTVYVPFGMTFATMPSVNLTLDTNGAAAPPYKQTVTMTGFTIKFQTNFTGIVSWQALK